MTKLQCCENPNWNDAVVDENDEPFPLCDNCGMTYNEYEYTHHIEDDEE